jgi:small ligand-binding sensory domain FIST
VKILKGGADAQAILQSARDGITQMLYSAGDSKPLVALISDCCARGMRLAKFGKAGDCEVADAILPAFGGKQVPIFGFYAWGELGPIAGPFAGLGCMYQQHTFVSLLLCEAK